MFDGLGDLHGAVLGVLAHVLDLLGQRVIKLSQDIEEHRRRVEVPARQWPRHEKPESAAATRLEQQEGHALGGVPSGEAISVLVVGVPEHLDRKVGRKRLRSSIKTDYFRPSTCNFERVF